MRNILLTTTIIGLSITSCSFKDYIVKKDAESEDQENTQPDAGSSSSSGTSRSTARSSHSTSTNEDSITEETKSSDAAEPDDAEDCSEQDYYLDNDGDGFGDPDSLELFCEPPEGYITQGDDCDDDCDSCFPGGTETCGNGKDENCDGSVDEGCPCEPDEERPCGSDEGECKAGIQECVEGQWGECSGASEATEEVCDYVDNDCDGETDELPSRQCGTDVGACEFGTETCTNGEWICSGGVTESTEVCDAQKIDEDCDGSSNEECACSEGDTLDCGKDQGICEKGKQKCVNGVFSDICEGEVKPDPQGELCDGAGFDEDCDGMTDVADGDCDCINGAKEECEEGRYVCSPGTRTCTNGKWGACMGVVNGSAESCNNRDDDCDGTVDNPSSMWSTLCPWGQTCENGQCVYCGDGIIDSNEECDIGANSDGGDGLPYGYTYDRFSCNPDTCTRRYVYTPCTGGGYSSSDCIGGYCSGKCIRTDICSSGNEVNGDTCSLGDGLNGRCYMTYCVPTCFSSSDCPQNSTCLAAQNNSFNFCN